MLVKQITDIHAQGSHTFNFGDFPGSFELFSVPAVMPWPSHHFIPAIQVDVTEAFVGGASFTIGIDGPEGKYFSMPGEDILGTLGVVQIDQAYPLVAGEVVKIYLSGTPSAGEFTLIL